MCMREDGVQLVLQLSCRCTSTGAGAACNAAATGGSSCGGCKGAVRMAQCCNVAGWHVTKRVCYRSHTRPAATAAAATVKVCMHACRGTIRVAAAGPYRGFMLQRVDVLADGAEGAPVGQGTANTLSAC
jgi:hypothetical protein